MKTITTAFFMMLLLSSVLTNAQSVLRYNFNNSLDEKSGNGPALTVLGNPGVFILDTLSEIEGNNKTVYRFEKNNGLQFNNASAGNFLKGSYTIELYFVFDELTSWKRVVDWKNRKTDWGAYVYYGKINFYNIITSNEAPVEEGEYTYYVITRDSTSNQVLMYTDAQEKVEFNDAGGSALIDQDGMLNLFFDDLIVPNEASSGAVALVNLYNYVLDSGDIVNSWNNIAGTVFGKKEVAFVPEFNIFPNPASDMITINPGSKFDQSSLTVSLTDFQGRRTKHCFSKGENSQFMIPVSNLPKGLYFVDIETGKQNYSTKVIIK